MTRYTIAYAYLILAITFLPVHNLAAEETATLENQETTEIVASETDSTETTQPGTETDEESSESSQENEEELEKSAPETTSESGPAPESTTNTPATASTTTASNSTSTQDESAHSSTSTDSTETKSTSSPQTAPHTTSSTSSNSATSSSQNGVTASTTLTNDEVGTSTEQTSTYTSSNSTAGNTVHAPTSGTSTASSTQTATSTTSSATTTIRTGISVATANIINLLNSNFINSEGAIVMLDMLGEQNDVIDLREAIQSGSIECSLTHCESQGIVVKIANDAAIDNSLIVSADSGNNTISDTENGEINTGAAYANANVINVANANIVNSRYLLAILNAFSNLNNDIVFPGLSAYISQSTPSHIELNNSAIVENAVQTNASTGNNVLTGSNGSISSGDATTGVSLFNQINSSLIGGESVSLLLRVHGDWNGEVFGLPEGVELIETNEGFLLDFSGLFTPVTTTGANASSSVHATNTARIKNNVVVNANTGNNTIDSDGASLISTGNAYAGASIINLANANVVGRNWMLGVINIYGDFTGNLAFGRPDIWVGGAVEIPRTVRAGDQVTYTYTITNRGDSRARSVVVTDDVSEHITPTDITITPERKATWELGTLEPGETRTITYSARVDTDQEAEAITNVITVSEYETDNNLADNTEIVTFFTSETSGGSVTRPNNGGSSGGSGGSDATSSGSTHTDQDTSGILDLVSITRSPVHTTVNSDNPTSTQSITLVNTSDKHIESVIFFDKLFSTTDTLIHEETWDLGTILPYEEIVLTYEISFTDAAPAGTYTFSSWTENRLGYLEEKNNGTLTIERYELVPAQVAFSRTESVPPRPTITIPAQKPESDVAGQSTSTQEKKPTILPRAEAADTLNSDKNRFSEGGLLALEVLSLILFMYAASRILRRKSPF